MFWQLLPAAISALGALLSPGRVQRIQPRTPPGMEELMRRLGTPYRPYEGIRDIELPPMAQQLLRGEPVFQQMPQLWEDYYRQAIEAPARREFAEVTLPGIREEFAGIPGAYWGGARAREVGRAHERFGEGLAAQRARTALEAEGLAGQRIMGLSPLLSQIAAQNLATRLQEHRLAQGIDDPRMHLLTQLILGAPQEMAYYQPSPWAQLLGPAATISAALLRR